MEQQERRTRPFDLIGDVHGCGEELSELLLKLGYAPDEAGIFSHAEGRKAVFVGDLVDRGPRVAQTLDTVMGMVAAGTALCVPGNHEARLERFGRGAKGRSRTACRKLWMISKRAARSITPAYKSSSRA